MNVGGGEAADQLVRMMLSGTEVAVRLSGSALMNLLTLTMALSHNRKTLSGKVNIGKMLRETRDLRRFPMTKRQYKQFKKAAKKHKLLFSVIKDKDDKGRLMDVILPVTELDRANAIFERILYTLPQEPEREPAREPQRGREVFQPERSAPERQAPEQAQGRRRSRKDPEQTVSGKKKDHRQQVPVSQRSTGQGRQAAPMRPEQPRQEASQQPAAQGRTEAPAVQGPEDTSKKGSRSERDSHVIAKSKRWTVKKLRKAIGEQLSYIEQAGKQLARFKSLALDVKLPNWLAARFEVIPKVYAQQKYMYDNHTHTVPDRIVSLAQPHVRPINRGKRPHPTEFGQKLHLSVVDGYTFLEQTSWSNFNEGCDLQAAAEDYLRKFGCYPEAILADKIYQTRANRAWC